MVLAWILVKLICGIIMILLCRGRIIIEEAPGFPTPTQCPSSSVVDATVYILYNIITLSLARVIGSHPYDPINQDSV